MPADEIVVYRPALREVIEGGSDWCVTFCSESDDSLWVQYADGLLNFSYPHDNDPVEIVRSAEIVELCEANLVGWEPQEYATFRVSGSSLDALARTVDHIFTNVLRQHGSFPITVQLFQLPP